MSSRLAQSYIAIRDMKNLPSDGLEGCPNVFQVGYEGYEEPALP